MFRVIFFVVVAAVAVVLSWLVAHIPGHFTASFGSVNIETSAPFAILALVILVGIILLVWQLCGAVLSLPGRGALWRTRRVRRLGEQSVTRLLIALAADEKREAWNEARRARRLLGDSPYTLLLTAEAARTSGHDDDAEKAYRTLAARRDARFLGLQGLLRQAISREDWAAASQLAKQAEETRPGTAWVRQERAQLALRTENWREALELAGDSDKRTTYLVAAAESETDPSRALNYAKKAWREGAAFPPAVLAYAQRLRARGQERKAQSIIRRAWQDKPQPDLAAFALAPETSKQGAFQAAKRLTDVNPTHPESRFLMACMAFEAGQFAEARRYTEMLLADGFQQRRVFLLLAEIEEAEAGDSEAGRLAQRQALRQAAAADADSRWHCQHCRSDQSEWHPKCPVCGTVGSIGWLSGRRRVETLPAVQPARVVTPPPAEPAGETTTVTIPNEPA